MPDRVPLHVATLSERVRETMQLRDLGFNELGRRMGKPPGYISLLLSGHRSPRAHNVAALARALGVHLNWLVEGTGPRDLDDGGDSSGDFDDGRFREIDLRDPYPNRRQLKLLDVYRDAPPAVQTFLNDAHFFHGDKRTIEGWLQELAIAKRLHRAGLLVKMKPEEMIDAEPRDEEASLPEGFWGDEGPIGSASKTTTVRRRRPRGD